MIPESVKCVANVVQTNRLIELCGYLHQDKLIERLNSENTTVESWTSFLETAKWVGIVIPTSLPMGAKIVDVIAAAASNARGSSLPDSKAEIMRRIKSNGVSINRAKVSDPAAITTPFINNLILVELGKKAKYLVELT